MSTQDLADPTAREAEERVERAKASLLSRLEQLKNKLTDAKHKVDLREQIVMHPLPAVGIAFGLGVLAALRRTRTPTSPDTGQHAVFGTVVAGLAALGLRLVRELALSQIGSIAKQWWTEQDGPSPREAQASKIDDVEPFLEH